MLIMTFKYIIKCYYNNKNPQNKINIICFYALKYSSICVFSQDPVHWVLYSVTMAIATNESRNVTSLMTVEMKRMNWIAGHPAHLNMGTVVGKTAWQIPLVGLMESAPFI